MRNLLKITFFLLCLIISNLNVQLFAEDKEDRLAQAQKKLEEASREYAELAAELGGENANHFVRSFAFTNDTPNPNKARIGINIGQTRGITDKNGNRTFENGRQDGVEVLGVSPESPADKVGLKSGDIITALNGQVLIDDGEKTTVKQLTDIMSLLNPGDAVDLMYTRDGITQSTTVVTDEMPKSNFKMLFGDSEMSFDGDIDIDIRGLEGLDALANLEGLEELEELKVFEKLGDAFGDSKFVFISKSPLGDAELAELSADLGDYFGTKKGLLVVKAPSDEELGIRDGDVILGIDGREPKSVSHAMRIMRSYQSGEEVKLEILRKKRKRKLTLTIPELGTGSSEKFHWNFDKSSKRQFPPKIEKRIKVFRGQENT